MPALLRIALLFCPRAFRREYESQIVEDAREARWTGAANLLYLCGNVALSGVILNVEALWHNTAWAARSLAKSRTYACVSIITIALAIGANIAVASVLEGVLFRPLPYPHAEQIYSVAQHGTYGGWSYINAHAYASQSRTVLQLGIASDDASTLLGRGRPVHLDGKQVDEQYFATLGMSPEIGRFIGTEDTGKSVAVISDSTWRGYFDANPRTVGARINLSGTYYAIIGVAPAAFRDPGPGSIDRAAYWVPDDTPSRHVRFRGDSAAFARFRSGVGIAGARADLHRIVSDLDRRYPNPAFPHPDPGSIVPLLSVIVGPVKSLLWLLYAAVDVLLLIACANVANLSLVRAVARERELVVRSALGATRTTLAAQLCTESAMLCVVGGALGAVLGCAALQYFTALGSQMLPRWDSVRIDWTLVAYTAVLVVLTTLVTGLLPVFWIRRDVANALKAAGRSGDRSASKALHGGFVVAEIAMALAVVVSAGLLVRSFTALTHSQLGFDPANVIDVRDVGLPMSSLDFAQRVRTIDAITEDLGKIPGVRAAAGAHWVPFAGAGLKITTSIPANASAQHDITFNTVTPAYFRVFQIPLLAGRAFTGADTLRSRPVAIVNASLARAYFGGVAQALGKSVYPKMDIGPGSLAPRTIIGVVGDTRNAYASAPEPYVYATMAQFPLLFNFVIRTDGRTAGIAKSIDDVFARRAPVAAPPVLVPYRTLLADDAINAHAAALLFGAFAIVAWLLALAGIYAVAAYAAEQRTQEFGIRRAVGARDADVLRKVLGRALLYGIAGVTVGLALAVFAGRSVSTLLFQTSPLDPATFASVIVLMLACSALAAIVPAIRATRIAPIEALRYE